MSGTLSVPNTFGSASGNVPASQLDANWAAVVNYINPREITIGTVGARPAAGTSGRWYFATDVNGGTLYADTGTAWQTLTAGITGGTVTRSLFVASDSGGITTAGQYWGGGAQGLLISDSNAGAIPSAFAGTARNLYCKCSSVVPVGESLACTLLVDGVASALTATIAAGNTTAQDTTNVVTVAAGQILQFTVVKVGTQAQHLGLSLEYRAT